VKRAWRLANESDVQRVWQEGRVFAHPLVLLRVRANGLPQTRAAFIAGKKLGGAVVRNRAKRRLREALRPRYLRIVPGYDLVLIARDTLLPATFAEINEAVEQVLKRARLIED
jgi:ribonuclease P protein component